MWWLNKLKWGSGRQHSNHLWDCGSFHNDFLCDANLLLTIALSYHICISRTQGLAFAVPSNTLSFAAWLTFCDSGIFHVGCDTPTAVCLRGRFTADAVSRLQQSWPTNLATCFFGSDSWIAIFHKQLRFGRVKRGYFGIVGWGERAICTYYIGYMLYHIMLGGFSQLWEPKIQVIPELCTVNSNKVWEP